MHGCEDCRAVMSCVPSCLSSRAISPNQWRGPITAKIAPYPSTRKVNAFSELLTSRKKSRRLGMLAQHHFALPQVKRRTTQQQLGLPRGAQTAKPGVDGMRRVGQAGTKHGHRDAGSDYP